MKTSIVFEKNKSLREIIKQLSLCVDTCLGFGSLNLTCFKMFSFLNNNLSLRKYSNEDINEIIQLVNKILSLISLYFKKYVIDYNCNEFTEEYYIRLFLDYFLFVIELRETPKTINFKICDNLQKHFIYLLNNKNEDEVIMNRCFLLIVDYRRCFDRDFIRNDLSSLLSKIMTLKRNNFVNKLFSINNLLIKYDELPLLEAFDFIYIQNSLIKLSLDITQSLICHEYIILILWKKMNDSNSIKLNSKINDKIQELLLFTVSKVDLVKF